MEVVEDEQRIPDTDAAKLLKDPAGAGVRAAHERGSVDEFTAVHLRAFAADGRGQGTGEGGLADPLGAPQAEYRRGDVGIEYMHGDVIDEAFLDLGEAGVPRVELLPHLGQIDLGGGVPVPRRIRQALQVLPGTDVLRVSRRPAGRGEAVEDPPALLPHRGRHAGAVEASAEPVEGLRTEGVGTEPSGEAPGRDTPDVQPPVPRLPPERHPPENGLDAPGKLPDARLGRVVRDDAAQRAIGDPHRRGRQPRRAVLGRDEGGSRAMASFSAAV